jgi:3-oxoacyl-[acyl-carrier protein] reductase
MFDLSGKSALITGASGSIGGAIARAVHGAGATVALSGTRVEALEDLASELGDKSHITPANLSDTESLASLIGAAEEAMGNVDILINNAGLTRDMLSMRLTDEDWQSVLHVNLTAAFRLSRGVMRGMMKRRWGRIINITSVVGVTKSMAQEVASRGITVNCVAPGMIITPMTDVLSDDQKKRILEIVPAGRLGESEEIAAGALYLASEEAAYVTGQTLHINGGMAMI